jgi:hypothetical protein
MPPCTWDYRPSTCALERVALRKNKVEGGVWVTARYKVKSSFGERIVEASVFHVFAAGTPREIAEGKVVAYFDRHPDLPCSWGHLTRGACARDDIRFTFPGCRDQRGNTCYELTPEELP